MKTKYESDVLIIGAGPVGLFAAFQAGLLGMRAIVVDSQSTVGGQLTALYPDKPIYDIPAFPEITAQALINNLEKQASRFEIPYLLNQSAEELSKEGDFFVVNTSSGNEIKIKAIIIAGGAGSFTPNKPSIEGLEEYEGKNVFYAVHNKEVFRGKRLAIVGGGDSALDWALELSDIAEKIYLIHRRDKFRAMPDTIEKARNLAKNSTNFEFRVPFSLTSFATGADGIASFGIKNLQTEDLQTIDANYLLAFYGLVRSLGGLKSWGLKIDEVNSTIAVNNKDFQTNIEGIYAIGDICSYEGKLKLIMTGFSEAAYSLHNAWQKVFPDEVFRFKHSTSIIK